MKYLCPSCKRETISYKQKFLAGYISKKHQYCLECNNRFKYSLRTNIYVAIIVITIELFIIFLIYKNSNFNFYNLIFALLGLSLLFPFIVHFGELVRNDRI